MLMDKTLYLNALRRKWGESMCAVLERLRGKSAEDILMECNLMDVIPVNLDAIFEHYGAKRIPTSFESLEKDPNLKGLGEISGLVLLDGDDVGIFYKKSDSLHRRRFTIAHELGHCCLHSDMLKNDYIEFRNSQNSTDPKEIEANTFAGELLMPEKQIKYILQRLKVPSLYGMAKIFNVSVTVMRKRLEYLKITYFDDAIDKYISVE